MKLCRLEDFRTPAEGAAVCLGTFDGVHRGHQALIACTVQAAHEKGLTSCAYTFDLPPACVLGRGKDDVLTGIEEKAELMGQYGIEQVVYSCFDRAIASLSAEDFFEKLLLNRLNAKHIVIGFHYHFGQFAKGDAALMHKYCMRAGVGLSVVPPVYLDGGELASSTAVRAHLRAGEREIAQRMLNRALSEREEHLLGGRINE